MDYLQNLQKVLGAKAPEAFASSMYMAVRNDKVLEATCKFDKYGWQKVSLRHIKDMHVSQNHNDAIVLTLASGSMTVTSTQLGNTFPGLPERYDEVSAAGFTGKCATELTLLHWLQQHHFEYSSLRYVDANTWALLPEMEYPDSVYSSTPLSDTSKVTKKKLVDYADLLTLYPGSKAYLDSCAALDVSSVQVREGLRMYTVMEQVIKPAVTSSLSLPPDMLP